MILFLTGKNNAQHSKQTIKQTNKQTNTKRPILTLFNGFMGESKVEFIPISNVYNVTSLIYHYIY